MNIYVGNLDYKVEKEDLQELFEAYGNVEEVKIITDKYSGRSKGFGFVTMNDPDEAQRAINELNDKTLGNRQIVVNEARERKNFK